MTTTRTFGEQECAVVAGVDLNGLGVIRSLAAASIPTIALDTDLGKATLATRYGRKARVPTLSGPAFVDALLALRGRFSNNPVLFLTQEASVATASAARADLSRAYRFSLPSESVLEMLLHKQRFQGVAERLGFAIPRSLSLVRSAPAVPEIHLRFPCVLKPTTKDPEYGKRFAKAYKVQDAREVGELWQRMREVVEDAILQEWIEGDDRDVYFCLVYRGRDPSHRTSFVGRKVCQWPPLVGGTASCVPAPEVAAELTATTEAFFDAVKFVGLGSMEYKRDRRDGRFYMIEPTAGRTDYQEEIATLNGVNIPLAAYLGELNRPLPQSMVVDPPRAWRDPMGSANARRAGAVDDIALIMPNARVCDAYFRARDPGPYFRLMAEPIRRRVSRFISR